MESQIRMTAVVAVVLRAFLDDIDGQRYGIELMRITGLPSGTLYPVLARLERAGWLISAMENIDPAVEGRPQRRYFTLNPAMAERARHEVGSLANRLQLPASRSAHLRPGIAGGAA